MTARADRRFRFHYIGNTHLPVTLEYNACAFTQKIHKLCGMLLKLGHEVVLYAAEGTNAPCTELVITHTLEEIRDTFGDHPPADDPLGYEWRTSHGGFRHDFDHKLPLSTHFDTVCVREIRARAKPDDFLLLSMGYYQKPIADALNMFLVCEPGIGYRGSFAKFRAFESSYIRNFKYGSEKPNQSVDGPNYDRVIPNYWRPEDFDITTVEPSDEEPYYLFMGRLIFRKGLTIAYDACKEAGLRLKIAGQGYRSWDPETKVLVDQDGNRLQMTDRIEFVGYADARKRLELMAGAVAVFCPTIYMEPFCGVNVEAQICGAPVITSDFGAFPETVEHGRTGFRCHRLRDYIDGAHAARDLDRTYIRERALSLYTCDAVSVHFEKWFQDLYDVYESAFIPGCKGWYKIDE